MLMMILQVIGLLVAVLFGTSIVVKMALKASISSVQVVAFTVGTVLFFFMRYGFLN